MGRRARMTNLAEIALWDNLLLAFRKASKGKRGRPEVAAFEYRLEDHLVELGSELRERRYRPGSYASFYIHDPKRRLISAAPFRDRVVHHALCNLIEPTFEVSVRPDHLDVRLSKRSNRTMTAVGGDRPLID